MKTIYIYIFLLISPYFIMEESHGQKLLDDYLVIAAESNPALKAKFNEYMAALEVVPQVSALPDPQFAFSYFIQPIETRVGPQKLKISVSQMFPWFGRLQANEDAATQKAKAKYEIFKDAQSRLYYDVSTSYYELYFIDKATRITRKNIDILNTFKRLALIKVEADLASTVDELRIEMEIADLENRLALLRDRSFAKSVAINNLLNIDERTVIHLPDTLWTDKLPANKQAVLDSIRINNHQLLSLDFEMESMKSKEIAARKTGLPNISIGIDYIFTGERGNPSFSPSESGRDAILFPKVGISIPLYRKKYSAMVKEAVLLQQVVSYMKDDKINVLKTLFENIYKDYNDASRRKILYAHQTGLAKRALQLLETEYVTNNKNFEEILRMERKVLLYDLELEKARTDQNATVSFTKYLTGK